MDAKGRFYWPQKPDAELLWKRRCKIKPNENKNGASEEVRTPDVHLGKVMLYQLSYARIRKF